MNKINEWLGGSYQDQIAFAIAIEETDAWVLTIHENGNTDTSTHQRPKERLQAHLNRSLSDSQKQMLKAKTFEKYDEY